MACTVTHHDAHLALVQLVAHQHLGAWDLMDTVLLVADIAGNGLPHDVFLTVHNLFRLCHMGSTSFLFIHSQNRKWS